MNFRILARRAASVLAHMQQMLLQDDPEKTAALDSIRCAITALQLQNPTLNAPVVERLRRVAMYIKIGYSDCPHLVARYGRCTACDADVTPPVAARTDRTLQLVVRNERIRLSPTTTIRPDLRAVAARVPTTAPKA